MIKPAKLKKPLALKPPSPLLLLRLKELDDEFLRQTKQLAKITKQATKQLSKKLTDKL